MEVEQIGEIRDRSPAARAADRAGSPGVAGLLPGGSLAIRTNVLIAAQRNLLFKMRHQPADVFGVHRFAVHRRA